MIQGDLICCMICKTITYIILYTIYFLSYANWSCNNQWKYLLLVGEESEANFSEWCFCSAFRCLEHTLPKVTERIHTWSGIIIMMVEGEGVQTLIGDKNVTFLFWFTKSKHQIPLSAMYVVIFIISKLSLNRFTTFWMQTNLISDLDKLSVYLNFMTKFVVQANVM